MQPKWLAKSATAIVLVALMATETVNPVPAYAGVPGIFATEYTQILNYLQLIGSLEKQVLMVENQLTQIADMAKHGITITNQLFGTVASDITNLNQIVKTGQSLSYTMSNLDSSFRLRFPGYSSSTNYGQSYQTWSQTSLDSTLGALNAAGLQNSQFNSDEALLQTLQGQSESAVGRMQAIEVGNQIAENQSEQLIKLRQLMMADMQSKASSSHSPKMKRRRSSPEFDRRTNRSLPALLLRPERALLDKTLCSAYPPSSVAAISSIAQTDSPQSGSPPR